MKKYVIATILVLFAGVSIAPGINLDAQIKSEQDKSRSIDTELKDTQRKINDAKKQETTLVQQIKDSNRNITQIQSQIINIQGELSAVTGKRRETEKELYVVEAELEKTVAELEKAVEQVNYDRATLNKRVANSYKYGDVTYIEMLLGATSFADLVTRASFLQMIVEQDYQILKRMEKTKETIEKKKLEIEANKSRVEKIKASLVAQEQRISAVKNAEEAKKHEEYNEKSRKQGLLQQVKESKEEYYAMERELERESVNVQSMIQSLIAQKQASSNNNGGSAPGRLIWPVNGSVSSEFGPRTSPCSGCSSNHKGMDIAAPNGTPIKAAASGTVLYAGGYGGYGNAVILDHGGGLATLYAHCSAIYVSKGQTVSTGSRIAAVGSTGLSTGNHLHFEVRVNGVAKNPRSYL